MDLLLVLALQVAAGFGRADVTPEPGAQMPGGFGRNPAEGTRDPLWAVAAVFSDGKNHVALVGLDALFTPRELTDKARAEIARATGIPAANVLVGSSHTHSGGPVTSCFGSEADPAYVDRVAAGVARAVKEAWESRLLCEIAVGTGREDSIAHNRRFLMKNGREITHPGKPGTKFHDQIVRPAGPVDPAVGVLAARTPKGAVRGIVVNYTCHCTVIGGKKFSADYVADLRKQLQARYGENVPVAFLQGACGDITQVDNRSTAREFGPEQAAMMGMKLAAEAARTLDRATWLTSFTVAAATEPVPVAIRAEPDAAAEDPPFGLGSGGDEVYARERVLVAEERARTPVIHAEVQGIRIGPLGIATNGAEYFVEYGLRIKEASPTPSTWFVGYANDYIGYVATPQAFAAGGYEVRTARSSKLSPDAGQKLLEGALRVLGTVKE
jgi:uncharacterized membrane protein